MIGHGGNGWGRGRAGGVREEGLAPVRVETGAPCGHQRCQLCFRVGQVEMPEHGSDTATPLEELDCCGSEPGFHSSQVRAVGSGLMRVSLRRND